jgi:3-oxoacyl-[acyl-carrier protein] reductase
MSDGYLEMAQTPWGNALISLLGLPKPPRLERGTAAWAERPLEGQGVVLGACDGAQLAQVLVDTLHRAGAQIRVGPSCRAWPRSSRPRPPRA